jgi:hypothetical protein
MADDDVVSYQLNSLLNEAERPLRPCALCERAPRAGDQDTENPIARLGAIFDTEYASEDMCTLCHHMAELASQWLSSTVTPDEIRRHFTSCRPNINAMCKDLLCQTYSNTKALEGRELSPSLIDLHRRQTRVFFDLAKEMPRS